MENADRYGIFKVLTTCPHCGNPVIVNGPQTQLTCTSCQQGVTIEPGLWKELIGSYVEEYDEFEPGEGKERTLDTATVDLKYTYVKLPPPDPACPNCETEWELAEVQTGFDGDVTCKSCGHTTPTFPAPAWLKEIVPTAAQIFFGEREATAEGGADLQAEAAGPISLSCPKCGASLPISAQTERSTSCKYCEVDVYLPDSIWLKLHPAKIAKFWLVRFTGA